MRVNDAVFGIILLLFSLAVILYSQSFPATHGQSYGPDLFPVLIALGLSLCGLALTLRGWMSRASVPWIEFGAWAQDRGKVITFALVPVGLISYVLVADFLGFIPTALLFLFVLLRRFAVAPAKALVIAFTATLVIHTIFVRFLLVPLPWGLLQPVAW
ncbi:tripartite tricarboxylate transporter TctB family protein [Pelagibius sp. Alg239-R121]|uniref:tripartite tricarboxylate transporter TctB family protein n=1 Tax=Pelagibius sp. Alg239-R121 TaxID=2993448 RepID=UPI0024A6FBE4|nr:tripartite tricarboxylate transporter TctB family protein [Pelagibius sp. Alg239-R121]